MALSILSIASASFIAPLYLDWGDRLDNGTVTRTTSDKGTIELYIAEIVGDVHDRTIQLTHKSSIYDICPSKSDDLSTPFETVFNVNGRDIGMESVCKNKDEKGSADLWYMSSVPKTDYDRQYIIDAFKKGKNVLITFPVVTIEGPTDMNAIGFTDTWNRLGGN